MPLDDLAGVIETLQRRIRQHGASLRENETRTRMALIDPLLQALGWDTADPGLVTPEYRVNVGWADYALHRPGTQPIAVIEAKRLGSTVDNHLDQAVGYCIEQGIAYAGVTDGNHWRLYRTFEPVPLADKLKLDVQIADAPAHQSALQMLMLWRPNLASGQPIAASEPIPAVSQPEPALPPAPVAPTPTPIPAPTPPGQSQSGWVALSSFTWRKGAPVPRLVQFPDGNQYPVQLWRNLVAMTATWLWSKRLLTPDNLPVPVPGGSRYVVSAEPIHISGNPFISPKTIEGSTAIIEGNVGGRAVNQLC